MKSSSREKNEVPLDANASRPAHPAAWEAYARVNAEAADAGDDAARTRLARKTLETARADVAATVGVAAQEIVFTSGGTEAAAWAVAGAMHLRSAGFVVTSALEHPAVAQTAAMVAKTPGFSWQRVPCDKSGRMSATAMQAACKTLMAQQRASTPARLVSLIAASNETGVLQPVAALADWCRDNGVLCHTDAVQAMGRQDVSLRDWRVDLASWAGHKVGAVGAIGCLYVRDGVKLQPPWLALNPEGASVGRLEDPEISPAAAAAMAAALRMRSPVVEAHLRELRDRFEAALQKCVPDVEIIGAQAPRLGHVSCLRFAGCQADGLLMALDLEGFFCSTGSACSSGSIEPSPVLLGMGYTSEQAHEALRFSFDDSVTEANLQRLLPRLAELVQAMRK